MSASNFLRLPDRIELVDVPVMQRATVDDLLHIQEVWPAFEELVGLRGRKMYARVDSTAGTYTVCTPLREGDDPHALGLEVGTLAGGWYLRGRLVGEPPAVYERIAPGMQELEASTVPDPSRPLVEFYRRYDEIDLWVPVASCPAVRCPATVVAP
ncbi:MAG: GyrI-like domain-containing protein [Acidimicrobiales bacterium]